jgi:hypothetical protein
MTESYGAVPPSEESVERSATPHRSVFYLTVVLVSLAVVVVAGVSIFRVLEVTPPPAVQGGLPPPVTMEQGRCRMCTFKECMADHCPRIRTNCTSCYLGSFDFLFSYFLIDCRRPNRLVRGRNVVPTVSRLQRRSSSVDGLAVLHRLLQQRVLLVGPELTGGPPGRAAPLPRVHPRRVPDFCARVPVPHLPLRVHQWRGNQRLHRESV